MQATIFFISSMHCASCKAKIESKLSNFSFIKKISVNLLEQSIHLSFDEQSNIQTNIQTIKKALAEQGYPIDKTEIKNINTINYTIEGLQNQNDIDKVKKAVAKIKGVEKIEINKSSKQVKLLYNKENISLRTVRHTIQSLGYILGSIIEETKKTNESLLKEIKSLHNKFYFSLLFSLPLLAITMGVMLFPFLAIPSLLLSALIQLALTIPILWLGRNFFIYGLIHLYRLAPNMDSLVALGSGSAFLYSLVNSIRLWVGSNNNISLHLYYESAGVIITLILMGKYLEAKSKNKASEAITMLANLTPKEAVLLVNDKQTTISSYEIETGDLLVVKNGEIFPADGIVEEGTTTANESMITGESLPILKEKGSYIIGATLNQGGTITMKTKQPAHHSRLSKIIEIMESTQSDKPQVSCLADKIATVFVPIIIAIAFLSAFVWLVTGANFAFTLQIFVSILVIACPCALGLATPTAIVVGNAKAASLGILFKNAYSLEQAGRISEIVFDKTGTITTGEMIVTGYSSLDSNFTKEMILQYAASIEQNISHPLATSIYKKSKQANISLLLVSDIQSIPGLGSKGKLNEKMLLIGSLRFFKQENFIVKQNQLTEWENSSQNLIYLGYDNKLIGILTLEDVLKEDSMETIVTLNKMSIKTSLLSGDRKKVVQKIANQAGISSVIAEVDPLQKANIIKEKQNSNKIIAMVGDGINDAPAMQQANIGMALAKGSDIAIEAASVIITNDSLKSVANSIDLSKKLLKNIKQNLFWAFVYNVIGIPIAAGILIPSYNIELNPIISAFAMSASSVFVLLNALRFRFFKPILPINQ